MVKRMHRAQILLEPEQHEALAELAEQKGESISAVVREILRDWLMEQDLIQQHRTELEALDRLTDLRLSIQEEKGLYTGDLIEEVREDRQLDLERVWREAE